MLIIPSNAASDAYQIARSLRFNSADSAYLSRAVTASGVTNDRRILTVFGWLKWCEFGTDLQTLYSSDSPDDAILWSGNKLRIYFAGAASGDVTFAPIKRDPGAWFPFMVAIDTTQATAANRHRVYFGNDEATYTGTAVTQNYDLGFTATTTVSIGRYQAGASRYCNCYLTHFSQVVGQQLTPASMGETSSLTNAFNPKDLSSLTFGTNGFWLKFEDNSNTTAATLGADSSGNGNNWTPNNFSVTAGVGNDSLTDTPTNYGTDTGAGGEVRGNYATWNPLDIGDGTLSNGNLDLASGSSSVCGTFVIDPSDTNGYYFEATATSLASSMSFGVVDRTKRVTSSNYVTTTDADQVIVHKRGAGGGNVWNYNQGVGGSGTADNATTGAAAVANDVIGIAIKAGKIWVRVTGTWYGADPSTSAGQVATVAKPVAPFAGVGGSWIANFGQRPFASTAPSGFKALCTQNLPTPAIAKPRQYFDTAIYAGTGASLAVSTDGSTANNTLALAPDLVWLKGRSGATDHAIYDNVRGVQKDWGSNLTTDETSQAQGVTAFGSTGFTVGTLAKLNTSAATYVSWLWKAGGAAASNTVGSITSSVSVNTTAGVSALTYTGTGANATIGHGIGVAPSMVIVKARTTAGADQGAVLWHASLTTPTTDYLVLSTTAALASAATMWNSTIPTSTVFSVGTNASTNTSGDTYVAYAFSPVDGFSAFGKYTGNAAADGPFVWCGFRPRWFMVKCASATNNWVIFDAARSTYNATNEELYADLADAGGSNNRGPDFLSNGVKIRATTSFQNSSGATYVFAAFAESPFKTARAR